MSLKAVHLTPSFEAVGEFSLLIGHSIISFSQDIELILFMGIYAKIKEITFGEKLNNPFLQHKPEILKLQKKTNFQGTALFFIQAI